MGAAGADRNIGGARRQALRDKLDAACARLEAKPPPEPKAERRKAMKAKLQTEDARAKYKRRKCTVEPVFGILKNVLGFPVPPLPPCQG